MWILGSHFLNWTPMIARYIPSPVIINLHQKNACVTMTLDYMLKIWAPFLGIVNIKNIYMWMVACYMWFFIETQRPHSHLLSLLHLDSNSQHKLCQNSDVALAKYLEDTIFNFIRQTFFSLTWSHIIATSSLSLSR